MSDNSSAASTRQKAVPSCGLLQMVATHPCCRWLPLIQGFHCSGAARGQAYPETSPQDQRVQGRSQRDL